MIGAVYLDAGWEAAQRVILRELDEPTPGLGADPDDFDRKSGLQEQAVCEAKGLPRYGSSAPVRTMIGSSSIHVFFGGSQAGSRRGQSKKFAEQDAAQNGLVGFRHA